MERLAGRALGHDGEHFVAAFGARDIGGGDDGHEHAGEGVEAIFAPDLLGIGFDAERCEPVGVETNEALFLARFATEVVVVHRRDELRASKIMQERARKHPKIRFEWNAEVDEVLGKDFVEGLRLRDVKTGAKRELAVEALFVAIGHKPNTDLVRGQLALDPVGYIEVERGGSRTAIPGVFACGDAMDPVYRQAVTAAGTGCVAAMDAERWLAEHD